MRLVHWVRRALFGFTWVGYYKTFNQALWKLVRWVRRHQPQPVYQHLPQMSAFDQAYGVSTAGNQSWTHLLTGTPDDPYVCGYSPSVPSVMRTILGRIPDPRGFTFIDIGCGKGRTLVIATEFPFKAVMGVELAASLCETARANARIIRERHPERPDIQVVEADGATAPLPAGDLVIYLFHPFWKPLMKTMVATIEAAVRAEKRRILVIYSHPLLRRYLDESPLLSYDPDLSCIIPPDDERMDADLVGFWHGRA